MLWNDDGMNMENMVINMGIHVDKCERKTRYTWYMRDKYAMNMVNNMA